MACNDVVVCEENCDASQLFAHLNIRLHWIQRKTPFGLRGLIT
jgi:hypothetical protein